MLIGWARAHFRTRFGAPRLAAPVGCAVVIMMLLGSGCQRKGVEDYLRMGDQAMGEGKLTDAERDYQSAVEKATDDPRTHIALGNLYVFEQKPGPAQLEFMKVLELDPRNAPAHAALARLYSSQSQYGLAESQYRAAAVLDPTRVNYRMELAAVLDKEGKRAGAEDELRTAIGLDPKNAQAHFALANLLSSEPGRDAEAQAEYAQARALDPRLVPPSAAASPAATPAAEAAVAPPATKAKVKPVDRRFLLTHNSPVYENPDPSSRVVAHVHKRGFVHVTGISGDWFQIRLHSGIVGFIPTSTAE